MVRRRAQIAVSVDGEEAKAKGECMGLTGHSLLACCACACPCGYPTVVQARNLHPSLPSPSSPPPRCGFALSLHVGLFHTVSAASFSSASDACAVRAAPPHDDTPVLLTAGTDGQAVWNAEVEVDLRNADAWMFVRAHVVPMEESASDSSSGAATKGRRRQQHHLASMQPGEARIPIKEYECGIFHNVWLTLRPPAASGPVLAAAHIGGQVHVRFMWTLDEVRQQAALARLNPQLGGVVAALLANDALWVQILFAHLDASSADTSGSASSSSSSASSASLLLSLLSLLCHARFGLVLHVLERLISREVEALARQHHRSSGGGLTSAWSANLFRRDSSAPKVLSALCLQQQQPLHHAQSHQHLQLPSPSSSFSSTPTAPAAGYCTREGLGKQYLLHLLSPFIHRVVHEVTHCPPALAVAAAAAASAAGGGAGDVSQNPYEIDPARLGFDKELLARNQQALLRACQALLDQILASLPHAASTYPRDEDPIARRAAAQAESLAEAFDARAFWASSTSGSLSGRGHDEVEGTPPPPVPEVPLAIKAMARTLKRTVEEYVMRAPVTEGDGSANPASSSSCGTDSPHSPSPSLDSPVPLATVAHESTANSLASFFFLRFLCPALVSPMHYGLVSRPPPAAASRALILMAKALQSLVNAAGSAGSQQQQQQQQPQQEQQQQQQPAPRREGEEDSAGTTPPATLASSLVSEDPSAPPTIAFPSFLSVSTPASPPLPSPTSAPPHRLFKERYMECAYPFINANLTRVGRFLHALASPAPGDAGVEEVLPGIEEMLDGPQSGSHGGAAPVDPDAEPSPTRELERSMWTIVSFLHSHLPGLEETVWRLHAEKSIRIPSSSSSCPSTTHGIGVGAGGSAGSVRETEGLGGAAGGTSTKTPRALLPSQTVVPESGLGALKELVKPRHYHLATRELRSPTHSHSHSPHSAAVGAPPSPARASPRTTVLSPPSTAQVTAFISRFRHAVEGVAIPPSIVEELAHAEAHGNQPAARRSFSSNDGGLTPPVGAGGEGGLFRSGSGGGHGLIPASAAELGSGAASALQQVASSSFKFLSRFLPLGAVGAGAGAGGMGHAGTGTPSSSMAPYASAGVWDGSPPPRSQKPRLSQSHSATVAPSASTSSCPSSSHQEDFQLFKQTSVEIQLRLVNQLEDADARCHSLLVSWQAEEQETQRLREEVAQLKRQMEEMKAGKGGADRAAETQEQAAAVATEEKESPASAPTTAAAVVADSSPVAPASTTAPSSHAVAPPRLRPPPPPHRIRRATPEDVQSMHEMILELALYERALECVVATAADLRVALFGPTPRVHAHVLEVLCEKGADDSADDADGAAANPSAHGAASPSSSAPSWRVAGMAIWFLTYSTWTGTHGLWLEDLYVRPTWRNFGFGRRLLRTLATECVEREYSRYEWKVLDWNTPAQGVYRAVGALPEDEWTTWRLDGERLRRFAEEEKEVEEESNKGGVRGALAAGRTGASDSVPVATAAAAGGDDDTSAPASPSTTPPSGGDATP